MRVGSWEWLGLSILALLFPLFAFLNDFKDWTTTISAWATLSLAVTAFWTVNKTIQENRRLREDEKYKNARRLALEQILKWVDDCLAIMDTVGLDSQEECFKFVSDGRNLWLDVTAVSFAAKQFSGDLPGIVSEACSKFSSFYDNMNGLYLAGEKGAIEEQTTLREKAKRDVKPLMFALWHIRNVGKAFRIFLLSY